MIKRVVIKDLILSALTVLILVGLLPTTANAGSVVNECKTGAECVDLGFKYITGKDVKQDDFKAVKFFQKACDLNFRGGCSFLGLMYGKGKGVKQDDFKAVKFYQKACDLNDGSGCSNLGLMYEKGKGVKQDDFKALKFYLKGVWFE